MTQTTHGHCAGNTHARPKKAETTTLSSLAPDTDLVFEARRVLLTDSQLVARELGMQPVRVMDQVTGILADFPEIGVSGTHAKSFDELVYFEEKTVRGKPVLVAMMNEPFFTLLMMRFKTKRAREKQREFNRAFYQMREYIQAIAINRIQAQPARIDGKGHRREFTDAIGHLVELSKAQGSLNGRFLYGHLTKHIYKSLGLFSGAAVPDGLRDRLTARELHDCSMLEAVMARRIDKLLAADDGTSYKTIRDAGCDAATQTAGLLEAA